MSQLRQHESELESLGVRVVIVTFQTGPVVEQYLRESALPWPVLADESLDLYAAYGMHRGRWWKILGPGSWWGYIKLMLRGQRPRRPTGDVYQLGGDVLIDPEGTVQFHHVSRTPVDRPPVSAILEVVRT